MKIEELQTLIGETLDGKLAKFKEEIDKKAEDTVEAAAQKAAKEEEEKSAKITAVIKEDPVAKEDEVQKEVDNKDWKSFGEFIKEIYSFRKGHKNIPDNRLIYVDKAGNPITPPEDTSKIERADQLVKTLTEGVDSAGGFVVPEQFVNEVRMIGLENSLIRKNGATVIPMATDTLLIPRIDDTSHASNVYGGVLAYWTEEAGTKTASDPKFGQCTLNAKELSGISVISDALLADNAVGLEALVKRMFGEAWAYFEDDSFINGNGVGQPLGILNSGALISVTRTDTNNITFADIPNMWSRLLPQSRSKAVWLMNHDVEKDLFKAGFSGATIAAGDYPIVLRNAVENPPTKIMGRPYFVTEKMATLGSAGDIGLFDLSQYIIGDRSKLAIDVSKHVYFTTNKTAWRFVIRVDGQPWMQSPITPKNGTNTLGPFVALTSTS